jgi:hypothetical protein
VSGVSAPRDAVVPDARGRPWTVVLAAALLVLATTPYVLAGIAVLVAPRAAAEGVARGAGGAVAPGDEVLVARVAGAVVLGGVLLHVVFVVLAFLGQRWARVLVVVLAAVFVVLLGLGLAGGGVGRESPADGAIAGVVIALTVVGAGLLLSPTASRWYARG